MTVHNGENCVVHQFIYPMPTRRIFTSDAPKWFELKKDQSIADELSDALNLISEALEKRSIPVDQISDNYGDFWSHLNDLIEDLEE